jgi:hypothetical protein
MIYTGRKLTAIEVVEYIAATGEPTCSACGDRWDEHYERCIAFDAPPPIPPEVLAERDRLLGDNKSGSMGLPAEMMTPPDPPREFKDKRFKP